MKHKPDCDRVYDGRLYVTGLYDVTGVHYSFCYRCGAFEHDPLKFGSRAGYLGSLSQWPDLEHTPYGHESALLDFSPSFYANDWTFHRDNPPRQPQVKNPVPVKFDPVDCLLKEDGNEHEGVSFRELWTDPIARTLWLGHKPFMLTNQYFRGACLGHAMQLRKAPDYLIGEHVMFDVGGGFGVDFEWARSIGAQLTPYLIGELDREGLWKFFRLPAARPLGWLTVKQ